MYNIVQPFKSIHQELRLELSSIFFFANAIVMYDIQVQHWGAVRIFGLGSRVS